MPMAAEEAAHGCCAEPGLRAAPMACCAKLTSGAPVDPALPNAPEAPAVPVETTAMVAFTAPQLLGLTASTQRFVPTSPPRILRI
jgi:hypothetical protein